MTSEHPSTPLTSMLNVERRDQSDHSMVTGEAP